MDLLYILDSCSYVILHFNFNRLTSQSKNLDTMENPMNIVEDVELKSTKKTVAEHDFQSLKMFAEDEFQSVDDMQSIALTKDSDLLVEPVVFKISDKSEVNLPEDGISAISAEISLRNTNEEVFEHSPAEISIGNTNEEVFEHSEERRRVALANWDWDNVISVSDDEEDEFEDAGFECLFSEFGDDPPKPIRIPLNHRVKRSRIMRLIDFSSDEE